MKIAVIGAGAIGSLIAAHLKNKDEDIVLVGRPLQTIPNTKNIIKVSGVKGNFQVNVPLLNRLSFSPDYVILATRTQDLKSAIKENLEFLINTTVVTTQIGLQADEIVCRYFQKDKIISSIIMFGATYLEQNKVVQNLEGAWVIGDIFENKISEEMLDLSMILNKAFQTVISQDIKGMKYLQVFVNANNCIPAVLGISMQEAFKDLSISKISVAVWKEGFEIISRMGIKLASLPGFPVENLNKFAVLPADEAAKEFSRAMLSISNDPLYGTILQSIKRGRPSEIDYINGEFLRLAKANGLSARLNEKLIELVQEVEKTKKFFTKEEFLSAVSSF